MTGEFYFEALGALGVSLAGFAALISALDRRAEGHTPVAAWRIRNIVMGGFAVTFIGFGTVAVHTVTTDEALTARVASLAIAAWAAVVMYREYRPGPAWPDERQRRLVLLVGAALVLLALGNVLRGSVGYLQGLMLGMLAGPASIFVLAVARIAQADRRAETSSPPDDAAQRP